MSDQGVLTTGGWIGPADRPLLSWLTTRRGRLRSTGVVIVSPVGYEWWSSHRAVRSLAEGLATQGYPVLRFDHDGTGDSAGDQWDPGRLDAWRRGVAHAAEELRRLGAFRLVLIGLRLGATLALLEGRAVGADAIVAWSPVVSGRRYRRELRVLGTSVPPEVRRPGSDGAVVVGGTVFRSDTLDALGAIDLDSLAPRPAERVLVLDRPDQPPSGGVVDRLGQLGCRVDHLVVPGSEGVLDRPAEYATVPTEIVARIVSWVGGLEAPGSEGREGLASGLRREPRCVLRWGTAAVTEEVVELGARGLVGVLSRRSPEGGRGRPDGGRQADQQGGSPAAATVVFLNAGSEPHVGPGRAWVEYARGLAGAGWAALRLDFAGWGESPDEGHAPGRPYDAHTQADIEHVVDALHRLGHERVVLAGLCAGAWAALHAACQLPLAGVIAINPQLYWTPGDPVEATMAETHSRRAGERTIDHRYRHLWTALDRVGLGHRAGHWLRELRRRQVPVLVLFAEGDDGLEFLRHRARSSMAQSQEAGLLRMHEMDGIDHPMHRQWLRREILTRIEQFLDATLGAPSGRIGAWPDGRIAAGTER